MTDFEKVTYHRDGSVTFWDVERQGWVRTDNPSDAQLASMCSTNRKKVIRHVGG